MSPLPGAVSATCHSMVNDAKKLHLLSLTHLQIGSLLAAIWRAKDRTSVAGKSG
jgi:hypothetical protein